MFEIKYQRKSDPTKTIFTGSVIVEDKKFAKAAFRAQLDVPEDYLILGVRDISTDNITLKVKDIKQSQKGVI